jgi:hypothetical protein
MKRMMTNGQLWLIEVDIDRVKKESPAIYLVLGKDFKKLTKNPTTAKAIKDLHRTVHAIQLQYIVHEKGAPQYVPGQEGKEWQYLESTEINGETITGPQVKESYMKEVGELFSRTISIEV